MLIVAHDAFARLLASAFGKVVTFDGMAATLLSKAEDHIDLVIPPSMGAKRGVVLEVSVDGRPSSPMAVSIAELAPGIFPNGVLNQDGSVNGESSGAPAGSTLQIFATGLIAEVPGNVLVVAGGLILTPDYAGAAPGNSGMNQVNVTLPEDMPPGPADLYVCGYPASTVDQPLCSPAARITVRRSQ